MTTTSSAAGANPRAAVLTISTSALAGRRADESGPLLAALAGDAGFDVVEQALVADERAAIEAHLRDYAGRGLELVLTTGGTGLTSDDVTPEATRAVVEREVPGMVHAMLAASLDHTPLAMLSRAVCGVAGSTLIVNLPGSPRAVRQVFPVLAPALTHAVAQIAGVGDGQHPG